MKLKYFVLATLFALSITTVESAYDYNTSNVCDSGSTGYAQNRVAYMCSHQALGSCNLRQAAAADGYDSFAEYGFGGFGANPQNSCCRCFQVQIQDNQAPAKDLIVQGINTGGDVSGGQIDLSMIAGGFGANNGCANKVYAWNGGAWDGRAGAAQYSNSKAGNWCSDPSSDNSQCNNPYSGGIRNRADCSKLPTSDLVSLCQYSFDTNWRIPSTGLRNTLMKEVRCPAGLRQLSGCDRDDPSLPLPSAKLSVNDPKVSRGTLTTMWDCCKPSCSWTSNVTNAKGTAVMSCDATGNVLGLGKPLTCATLTCDSSCQSCSVSNNASKCTACKSGYFLSSNPGSCVACPTALNCTSCSNSTSCTGCKTGYTLQSNGQCTLPCDSSCTTCSTPQNANFCTACNSGFYLSGNPGKCVSCLASLNCTSCSNSSTCTACKANYTLSNGVCKPVCSTSCATCNSPQSATSCLTCPTGFYLTSVGSCVTCPSSLNCSNCSNATTCITCKANYTLQTNKTCLAGCDGSCKTCSSPLDSTKCTACNNGFYLNGSTAGSCVQCPSNCSSCTGASGCTNCINNTLLQSGLCKACTSPCNTCQTALTTCTSCISGYSLSGNTCKQQTSGTCDPACVTCSSPNNPNACTSCPVGKLVIGGNCQPCQPQCATCSGDPNSCTACANGYGMQNARCVQLLSDSTKCYSSCTTCTQPNNQYSCVTCAKGLKLASNNSCS